MSDVWSEHDAPRLALLRQREARILALGAESRAVRNRSGLPDLRPRGAVMVRTPRGRVATRAAYAHLGMSVPSANPALFD